MVVILLSLFLTAFDVAQQKHPYAVAARVVELNRPPHTHIHTVAASHNSLARNCLIRRHGQKNKLFIHG
jgi:hypothetical protein